MGVASWYLLDGAFYVFAGVRRLPLRMNPFDGFSALGPLEALAATMMRIALTEALFILLVIGSFTFLGAQGNEGVWLLWWAAIGTTGVGAAISQTVTRDTVAFRQRGALPITLIYVGAFVALSLHPVEVSLIPGLVAFSLRWLVSGAFLSLFLHYTTGEVRRSLILSRERVKQEHLSAIESQIQELSDSLLVLRISDERQKRKSCDLLTSENLLSALRSRHDLLKAVRTSGRRVATVIQSMGPLLISLAVPNLVELVRLVRSLFENPA
jgi:hypothetical protein